MLSPPGMIHSTLSLRLFSIGVISPRLKASYMPLTISVFVIEFALSKKCTSKPKDRISISPDFFQMIRQFAESFRAGSRSKSCRALEAGQLDKQCAYLRRPHRLRQDKRVVEEQFSP